MSAMLVRGIRAGKANSACKNMVILENYARETWGKVAKSWLLLPRCSGGGTGDLGETRGELRECRAAKATTIARKRA